MTRIKSFILVLILASCNQSYIYKNEATENCSNLTFQISGLYPNETMFLYYNKDLILKYERDSTSNSVLIRRFCIDFNNEGTLKLISKNNSKIYIDTMFRVKREKFGYELSVSNPLPKNWKLLYERDSTIAFQGFGYVPIEESVRYFRIHPDNEIAK